jgi:hypothetical protein
MTTKYISTADTAKLIRKELKANFPAIKFSVKSKVYSGGSSIRVYWTDGVLTAQVKSIVDKFSGASFDSMQDLKSHHTSEYNGEKVHFGADYIFCERGISQRLMRDAAIEVAYKYGVEFHDMPRVVVGNSGSVWCEDNGKKPYESSRDTLADLVHQQAREMTASV